MKALVLNNKVVDLVKKEFPVNSEMKWIDVDDTVKTGDSYNGVHFTRPPVYIPTPQEKIKKEIEDIGLSDDVENIMDAMLIYDILMFESISEETLNKYLMKKTLKNK